MFLSEKKLLVWIFFADRNESVTFAYLVLTPDLLGR